MVKKIRRRVEKEATPSEAEVAEQIAAVEEDGGFVADLERLAEDSFTQSIVDGLKVVHKYRKLLLIGTVVLLGLFAFQQLQQVGQQEEIGEEARLVESALKALESGQGIQTRAGSQTEDAELSDEQRTAKLSLAARDFARLSAPGPIGDFGQATSNLALANHEKALTHYKAAFNSSKSISCSRRSH